MDMVCEHLNLLEKDYFGLTFADADTQKVSESGATLKPRGKCFCINTLLSGQSVFLSLAGWVCSVKGELFILGV